MKKEKTLYRFLRYKGKQIEAKKEIPFELKMTSRLVLDELCFNWNRKHVEDKIDDTLTSGDKQEFARWSEVYKEYIWE
ncbi:IDEAL domain-containing protein [Virgibacillus sediminis]|uniref:IDEAL domain-containing protein n=1 Tax=Virgibacillus sediminis TaxID=202260 RepID=A0ABV7A510_9BACI